MNALGIFAKTFVRPALDEVLDAVVAHGLHEVQFNLACAGLPTLPDSMEPGHAEAIGHAIRERGLRVAAVSGTFNLIDPVVSRRNEFLNRLGVLAAACPALDTRIITLCSGTRDPNDMWTAHPGNQSETAWCTLLASLSEILRRTEGRDVVFAIEPEPANVVRTAGHARRLLDELRSPRLKILLDGANLLAGDPHADPANLLAESFELAGDDIALVHAKEFQAGVPGRGNLPWEHYLRLVEQSGYRGPIILHGFAENDTEEAIAFMRTRL